MPNHDDVVIHSGDLADRLFTDSDNNSEAVAEVRSKPGWYVASWPNHVVNPRYNGDGDYRFIGETLDAEAAADCLDAKVYGDPRDRTLADCYADDDWPVEPGDGTGVPSRL